MRTSPEALTETPDVYGAYPRLDHAQIDMLTAYGQRRQTAVGDVLYREGDIGNEFIVILEGMVTGVSGCDTADEAMVWVHGPGRFLGELSLMTGEACFVTAVVSQAGEVLSVPVNRLRDAIAGSPWLGDLVFRAYLTRRSILIGLGTGLRILGSRFSPDCRRLCEFATRNRIPHRWTDLEQDHAAEQLIRSLGLTETDTPVVIWHGEALLRNPDQRGAGTSDRPIRRRRPRHLLGPSHRRRRPSRVGGVCVRGVGGPGCPHHRCRGDWRAGRVVSADRELSRVPLGDPGRRAGRACPGPSQKVRGQINVPGEAVALAAHGEGYAVTLSDGTKCLAHTVLIATEARYRSLELAGGSKLEGMGVFYTATEVELQKCAGEPVVVVGGGNSAGQASIALASHAASVTLVVRSDDLGKDMSRYLVDRIVRSNAIRVLTHHEVGELIAQGSLEAVLVEDKWSGHRQRVEARALFVFIGAEPHVRWLSGLIALDSRGFVLTGRDVPAIDGLPERGPFRGPKLIETSRAGVFAAGDVRSGSLKRVATATGEGALAVRLVHEHLAQVMPSRGESR